MTLQQLNYFIEACRCNSIATAAERLYISPSGLRMALHRIEQELGCKLLDWGAKGVRPTEEGIYFLKRACEISSIYGQIEEHYGLRTSEPFVAKVAVGEHFPNLFVTSLCAAFNRSSGKHRVMYRDFFDAQTAVGDGAMEIGFDSGPVDRKNFVAEHIIDYPIYAVVNEKGPFGEYEALPPRCLDGTEIIVNEKRSRNAEFYKACRKHHVEPITCDTVGRELTVFYGVQIDQRRIGITNVECAEVISIPGIKVIPIDSRDFVEQIFMFRKRGDYISPAAELFESFVKSELKRNPDEGNNF